MRMIDADELKLKIVEEGQQSKRYKVGDFWELNRDEIWRAIDDMPTIEERKTGKWTPKENRPKQEVFICSECGGWAYSPWIGSRKTPKPNKCKYSYCPNCGARMER